MTWEEVCTHPDLRDLPFHIETNRWGQIVMSPPHNDQFFAQAFIYNTLRKQMPGGAVLREAVIDTDDGNKVADGVWMSEAFLKAHKGQASFNRAPEICVEIKSPGNSMKERLEKKELYFNAGAREVWRREKSGKMRFFDADGPRKRAALCPGFPATAPI